MGKIKFEIAEKHIMPLKVISIVLFGILSAWVFTGLHLFINSIFCINKEFIQFLAFITFISLWALSMFLFITYIEPDF